MIDKKLLIKNYDYNLPDDKIAKYPLQNRDESKLLIFKNDKTEQDFYYNLDKHLPKNSLLIFNNTKVIEARLLFKKNNETVIEIFCLEPSDEYADITTAMLQKQKVFWKCLVGGAKKWKDNLLQKDIQHNGKSFLLNAKKIKKESDYFLIEFSWNADALSFSEVLHLAGATPLPPYLHREAEEKDKETYQTVYAKFEGSVAAPTAGLHFTERIFSKLSAKKIETDFVTLHVGAGTFKPVKTETIDAHEMHSEFFEAGKNLVENLLKNINENIIAVGTTSLRTIETLYWLGVKSIHQSTINEQWMMDKELSQWEVYDLPQNISAKIALQSLLNWMNKNKIEKIISKTQIIIIPGYKLKIAKALLTNFHQPKSTLLLLVAAVAGNNWKKIYDYALKNNFRFLSYGDGSLIWNAV